MQRGKQMGILLGSVTFQGVRTESAHINGTDGDNLVYTFLCLAPINVGASLLANAVDQATETLTVTALSRAGSLPQVFL